MEVDLMQKDEVDEEKDNGSADSSESEEEPLWTANEERGFLRALSAIKSRDPKIYKNSTNFFDESNQIPSTSVAEKKSESRKRKKDEKMTLRDYERKLVTERGGRLSEDESDDNDDGEDGGEGENDGVDGSNFDKQQRMREEFKQLFNADDDEESGDEELLRKRVKTEEQKKREEDDYYEWLKGGGSLEMLDEDLVKLKKRWAKREELDSDELFLRDYLLEKQYENEVDEEEIIPSYDQIVQQEAEEEEVEKFEHKYNFRFEEPDQEFIKQYPRTVKESLRDSRTRRRERRLEKKRMERELLKKIMSEPDPASDDDDESAGFKFKYRSVPANDYGLSVEEILTADDKQLNAWVSTKRVCAYRSNDEEQRDILRYQRKAQNTALKEKIFRASSPPPESAEIKVNVNEQGEKLSKSKRKKLRLKKKKKMQNVDSGVSNGNGFTTATPLENGETIATNGVQPKASATNYDDDEPQQQPKLAKKNRNKKKVKKAVENAAATTQQNGKGAAKPQQNDKKEKVGVIDALSDDRLRAYGVRTKRLKRLLYNKKAEKRKATAANSQK